MRKTKDLEYAELDVLGFDQVPLIAERELLACLISNPDLIDAFAIDEDDFWDKKNKKLFLALLSVLHHSTADIRMKAILEQTGLNEELFLGISGVSFASHLKEVRTNNKKRDLAKLVLKKIDMDKFNSDLEKIVHDKPTKTISMIDLGQFTEKHLKFLDKTKKQVEDTGSLGFLTGIRDLDRHVKFTRGKFIIIAAKQSVGKSVLAMNATINMAIHGAKILFISLEMDEHEIANRIISHSLQIDHDRIVEGRLTEKEIIESRVFMTGLKEKYYILNCPSATLEDIRSYVHRLQPDVVVIDHIDLMNFKSKYNQNEATAIGEVTKGLKGLAGQYKCTVIGLSQFNRETKEEDEAPKVHELRGSGAKEQDADCILILHRKKKAEADEFAWIHVEKNRAGALCQIPLVWTPHHLTFKQGEYGLTISGD